MVFYIGYPALLGEEKGTRRSGFGYVGHPVRSLPEQHVPHATLKKSSPGINTQSLRTALRAVGGVQTLLPLFAQLDQPLEPRAGKEYGNKPL